MKLTWFGGTTVRILIGGSILVIDAADLPLPGIARVELLSAADQSIVGFGQNLQHVDAKVWKPRRTPTLLNEADIVSPVEAWKLGEGTLAIDAFGEPMLVLSKTFDLPDFGRWAEQAVFMLIGTDLRERAQAVRGDVLPKLIILAGEEHEIDAAFQLYAEEMSDTGLVAAEAGLAIEV